LQCQICNKTTASFVDEKTDITYHHCKVCEYIFKSPEHYIALDAQKERYDIHENDENSVGYRAYFQRFLDFVLPFVGAPKNALDFGCGESSLLAKMLRESGIETDYYDPIYHPSNLDDSKKYELIVSTEVFEHLHQPRVVFEMLISRLEEGGYLAIQTQFHPNEEEAFKKWWYHQDETHIVFFRAKTFRVLSEMYGCEFVEDNGANMVLLRRAQEPKW